MPNILPYDLDVPTHLNYTPKQTDTNTLLPTNTNGVIPSSFAEALRIIKCLTIHVKQLTEIRPQAYKKIILEPQILVTIGISLSQHVHQP